MKYFIPANKAPPIANVTAKDFQETGYWGRDFKIKNISKVHLITLNLLQQFLKYIHRGLDLVKHAGCFTVPWDEKIQLQLSS